MLKKEKLITLHYIVLMLLFDYFMQMWEICNFQAKTLLFRNVLVLVDLFSSKTYTYPMESRKQIRQKLQQFYRDVRSKRKGKKMKLQVDQVFQPVKIKDLNDLNNVEMFSTSLRGGKAFDAEQKIRELKTRIAKLHGEKLKISPKKITEMSAASMNILVSKKYGFSPEEVEKRALDSERTVQKFTICIGQIKRIN